MRPPRTLVSTFSMMLSFWNPRIPGFCVHSLLQPRSLLSSVGNEAVQNFELCLGLLKEALQPTGCFSSLLQYHFDIHSFLSRFVPQEAISTFWAQYTSIRLRGKKRGAVALLCPYSLCNPLEHMCVQLWGLEGLYCFNSNLFLS